MARNESGLLNTGLERWTINYTSGSSQMFYLVRSLEWTFLRLKFRLKLDLVGMAESIEITKIKDELVESTHFFFF